MNKYITPILRILISLYFLYALINSFHERQGDGIPDDSYMIATWVAVVISLIYIIYNALQAMVEFRLIKLRLTIIRVLSLILNFIFEVFIAMGILSNSYYTGWAYYKWLLTFLIVFYLFWQDILIIKRRLAKSS